MRIPIKLVGLAFVVAAVLAIFIGGFLSVTVGAVAGAVLPSDVTAEMVAPWACPSGAEAEIDTWDTQCNDHNNSSGTCQQLEIECLDSSGEVVETLDPNSSMLWVMGVTMGYSFVVIGGLIFFLSFVLIIVGARRKRARELARR